MAVTTSADRKWTYDDLRRLPYDGKRHEIIDGEHFVMSSPYPIHQAVLGRLHLAIGNFLTARPEAGQVFVGPLDVVLTMFDVVEPDLLVVAADQAGIVTDKHVRGAPALVVEILSKSTRRRDERVKRALYEREGVQEYWIIDTERRLVAVHRRTAAGLLCRVENAVADHGDAVTTPLLPGFALRVASLFV